VEWDVEAARLAALETAADSIVAVPADPMRQMIGGT
jgi:hypothetical protein